MAAGIEWRTVFSSAAVGSSGEVSENGVRHTSRNGYWHGFQSPVLLRMADRGQDSGIEGNCVLLQDPGENLGERSENILKFSKIYGCHEFSAWSGRSGKDNPRYFVGWNHWRPKAIFSDERRNIRAALDQCVRWSPHNYGSDLRLVASYNYGPVLQNGDNRWKPTAQLGNGEMDEVAGSRNGSDPFTPEDTTRVRGLNGGMGEGGLGECSERAIVELSSPPRNVNEKVWEGAVETENTGEVTDRQVKVEGCEASFAPDRLKNDGFAACEPVGESVDNIKNSENVADNSVSSAHVMGNGGVVQIEDLHNIFVGGIGGTARSRAEETRDRDNSGKNRLFSIQSDTPDETAFRDTSQLIVDHERQSPGQISSRDGERESACRILKSCLEAAGMVPLDSEAVVRRAPAFVEKLIVRTREEKEANLLLTGMLTDSIHGIGKGEGSDLLPGRVYGNKLQDNLVESTTPPMLSPMLMESDAENREAEMLKILGKGSLGLFEAYLESVGVRPRDATRVARAAGGGPLMQSIAKVQFVRDLLMDMTSPRDRVSGLLHRLRNSLQLSVVDESLQQTLAFMQRLEAQRGGLAQLDDPSMASARLLESFPQILQCSLENQLVPLIDSMVETFSMPRKCAGTVILCFPSILLYDWECDILPKKRCLKEIGIRVRDMGHMTFKFPWLFAPSIINNLQPTANFLLSMKVPISKVERMLTQCPGLLSRSPEKSFLPAVQYLGTMGLEGKRLTKAVTASGNLLCRSPKELQQALEFFLDVGISPEHMSSVIYRCPEALTASIEDGLRPKMLFLRNKVGLRKEQLARVVRGYPELLSMSTSAMLARLEFLKEMGFNGTDVAIMVHRFPPMLGYNVEGVLRPKLLFLVEEMDRSKDEVVLYPRYFSYSMDRIQRRARVVANRNVEIDLKTLLQCNDDVFASEFLGFGSLLVRM